VGHSAHHDLTALRWIHYNVSDTFLLESSFADTAEHKKEVPLHSKLGSLTLSDVITKIAVVGEQGRSKGNGRLSLKTLSRVKLGREIQTGKNGHDSVEDALAARDLVYAHLAF